MKILPAIDLREGQVVRLTRGDFSRQKIYSHVPEQVALKWQRDGASMLHVVDLDGALSGRRKNLGSLKNICSAVRIPIQFGGGLRSVASVADVFRTGVQRAVIGTKALDFKMLKRLVKRFGERIVVGIDVRDGDIQIHGWKKRVKLVKLDSFCKEIEAIGVRHVVYTDVSRDGTLLGPNIAGLKHILKSAKINIIASGGISSLDDLTSLKSLKYPNLWGVIVGKALYENKFTLPEALKLLKGVH